MTTEQGFKICDFDKVVVMDTKTLLPGYLELKNGLITKFSSDDPNNNLPSNPQLLKNRLVDDNGNSVVLENTSPAVGIKKSKIVFHFCNIGCLNDYLNRTKNKLSVKK